MKRNENSETVSTEVLEFALSRTEVKSAILSTIPENLKEYSLQIEIHGDGTAYVRATKQKTLRAPTLESVINVQGFKEKGSDLR